MAHYPTSTQRSKWTFNAAVLAEKHDANNRRAVMAVREHYRAAAADGQGADRSGDGGDRAAPHRCVEVVRALGCNGAPPQWSAVVCPCVPPCTARHVVLAFHVHTAATATGSRLSRSEQREEASEEARLMGLCGVVQQHPERAVGMRPAVGGGGGRHPQVLRATAARAVCQLRLPTQGEKEHWSRRVGGSTRTPCPYGRSPCCRGRPGVRVS